jgi:FkbM family methyltransferase
VTGVQTCALPISKYPKVIYANHQNWSYSDRINWFFQNAHGKYVRLIGGHDMVSTGSTKSMVALLESDPDAVMVYSKYCIYLNSDYTLKEYDEMSNQWCRNLTSIDPFIRTDSAIEYVKPHIYYGLYKYDLLKQFMSSNILLTTDLACYLYMASKGKLLSDDTSFFFWMCPRKQMDIVSEYIRVAKTFSTGESEHPFYFAFAAVIDSYNIAKEIQKLPNAPKDFDKKILYHWLDYFHRFKLLDREIILDEMPTVTSGNEKIFNEVYALIKEYQKSRSVVTTATVVTNTSKFSKIKTSIKEIFKWILPYGIVQFVRAAINPPYTQLHNVTYSQSGEDTIISHLLTDYGKYRIKYLDIRTDGLILFSNTYRLYLEGSNGVCVENNTALISAIKKMRPNDTIISTNIAANSNGKANFYMSQDDKSELHSSDKEESTECVEYQDSHKTKTNQTIPLVTINDLIKNNFVSYPDFISIDVEGSDLDVLKTLDFDIYPIPVICVRTCLYSNNLIIRKNVTIIDFMLTKNYEIYADTYVNTIFVHKDWFYKKN